MVKAQKSLSQPFYSFSNLQSLHKAEVWLFPMIKNMHSLSSLTFDCRVSFPLRFLKRLFMSLAALKRFNKLIISMKPEEMQDDKIFRSSIKFLQRIKTLVNISVSLEVPQVPPVPIRHSQAFSSHLKKLTQLRALEVKVSGLGNLENFIDHLALILLNLPQLTKISLKFPESTTLQNSSLRQLFVSLQSLKSLSSLKLKLLYRPGFQENDPRPFSEYLRYLNRTQLHELNLKFYGAYNEKKILRLSKALEGFTSLQHLKLNFSKCCRLQELGMRLFSLAFYGLVKLESLNLYFSSPYRNELIMPTIADALRSLVNLNTLKLSFVYNMTATEDDRNYLFVILRWLKLLKSIDLFFGDKNVVTDDDLETLRQSLKQLLLLNNLSLYFTNSKSLTNKGIEGLARGIQPLKNLKDLQLGFGCFNQAGERGFKMLGEALQDLPVLSSFTFHFSGFSWRRENDPSGLADFFTGLTLIKNPVEIFLRIPKKKQIVKKQKNCSK